MSSARQGVVRWVQFGTFLLLWFGIVYATQGSVVITGQALSKVPLAIVGYGAAQLLFTRWLWKTPYLHGWLVPFPNLEGTWEGEIHSTSTGPGVERGRAISAQMVIAQSFEDITVTVRTEESESVSVAASLRASESGLGWTISYVYVNRPRARVRRRSVIHDGAATCQIQLKPERQLKGEYWTSRRTTGEMNFTFRGRSKWPA